MKSVIIKQVQDIYQIYIHDSNARTVGDKLSGEFTTIKGAVIKANKILQEFIEDEEPFRDGIIFRLKGNKDV